MHESNCVCLKEPVSQSLHGEKELKVQADFRQPCFAPYQHSTLNIHKLPCLFEKGLNCSAGLHGLQK